MNDIHRVHYQDGSPMPLSDDATYLGGKVYNNGDYKKEIANRIKNTWYTVKQLDLLWRKAPVSLKWKLRVYDAVIVAKVLYGLEAIPFTERDCAKLDAFQYRGLRKILQIKHPYWSRVKNETVLQTANQLARTDDKNKILPLSHRLRKKQVTLYGHLIRADENDPMRQATMEHDSRRKTAAFRRWGRPRFKWHTVTRQHVIQTLTQESIIPHNWRTHMLDRELDQIIMEAAQERAF
jgi:hypothetical protein